MFLQVINFLENVLIKFNNLVKLFETLCNNITYKETVAEVIVKKLTIVNKNEHIFFKLLTIYYRIANYLYYH